MIRAKAPVQQWLITSLRFAARRDQRPGLRPLVFRILPPGPQRHAGGDDVATADDAGFVLRLHALGQHSTRAIHEEFQWLSAIRQETPLMVPTPAPAHDGSLIQEMPALGEPTPRQCVLFHWVPGDCRNDTLNAQRHARRRGVHGAVARPRGPVCRLAHPPTRAARPVL